LNWHAFLDQDLNEALRVIHTNVDGTVRLIHAVGSDMRARRQGRILITGSIAGLMPGTFQAVYNGSKAFLDSFSVALSNELKDTGVTVTCLMPGATETDFFERADMMDTKVRHFGEDECRRGRSEWFRCHDGR
jgi:short-subunit dehydrogenase